MKAKPYTKRYSVLHITKDTTRKELGEFINDHDRVGIAIHGIGFCADTSITLDYGNKVMDIYPGAVFLKNHEGNVTVIDNQAYNMLFHEEDN